MHGYKDVGLHNYPGMRSENDGKCRNHLWGSRQQSADRADIDKTASDWKAKSMKFTPNKTWERWPEYEIRAYSK